MNTLYDLDDYFTHKECENPIFKDEPEILYEDEFCTLTDTNLQIKKYFFPTMKCKNIPVKKIKVVYFDAQNEAKYANRRIWGLTKTNNVYWAADFKRVFFNEKTSKMDVVVDIEDGLLKGFTVRDGLTFVSALRCIVPMYTIIADNLNIN